MADDPGRRTHELADGMADRERGAVGILGSIPWDGTLRQMVHQERVRWIVADTRFHRHPSVCLNPWPTSAWRWQRNGALKEQ
jgi:hypothetical protein